MKKRRVIFRLFSFNRLTIPLLLNIWEKEEIDKEMEIVIAEDVSQVRRGDIVIYSFMTPHLPVIHKEILDLQDSNIVFAGGGPHITGDTVLSRKIGLDILIPGQAEKSFKKFGMDIINGKIRSKSFRIYQEEQDNNIDEYLPVTKYMNLISPLEIMRGCKWNCRYCQTGNISLLERNDISINKYLLELKKRDFKRVGFIAPSSLEFGLRDVSSKNKGHNRLDNLLSKADKMNFKFIEYGLFPSEIRPETFNEKTASLLKKYVSNRIITFGVQSGSEKRLKNIRRAHNKSDVEIAVATANSFGFKVNLDFILCYPDETNKERTETFDFISSLIAKYQVRIQFHHFFPLSGSEFQFRLPSPLPDEEKNRLFYLKKNGLSNATWSEKESDFNNFELWMKTYFPEFYKNYD